MKALSVYEVPMRDANLQAFVEEMEEALTTKTEGRVIFTLRQLLERLRSTPAQTL